MFYRNKEAIKTLISKLDKSLQDIEFANISTK